jgi:hypothetical protein
VRPFLTVALLLAASIGAQAGDAELHVGGGIPAPGLLAALIDQPAGILAASHLALPPTGSFLLDRFAPGSSAICAERLLLPAAGQAVATIGFRSPAIHSPAYLLRFTRGP